MSAEQRQHQTRDGRGDRGLEEGKAEEGEEHHRERERQRDEAQMPAVEVEIDEEEREQRRGDAGLGGGAERLRRAVGDAEQRAEDAEVDEQVDQHRPGEGRGGREDAPAPHHEHDGEEHRRERRDAEHHAAEQREGVDVVAIGVGLPQVEFGQRIAAQFGDEGDRGAGIEGDLEDIGFAVGQAHGADAGAGGQRVDAQRPEIGAEDAGARAGGRTARRAGGRSARRNRCAARRCPSWGWCRSGWRARRCGG